MHDIEFTAGRELDLHMGFGFRITDCVRTPREWYITAINPTTAIMGDVIKEENGELQPRFAILFVFAKLTTLQAQSARLQRTPPRRRHLNVLSTRSLSNQWRKRSPRL